MNKSHITYSECWWECADIYLSTIHEIGKKAVNYTSRLEQLKSTGAIMEITHQDRKIQPIMNIESDWVTIQYIFGEENSLHDVCPGIPSEIADIKLIPDVPHLARCLIWGAGIEYPEKCSWVVINSKLNNTSIAPYNIMKMDFPLWSLLTLNPFHTEAKHERTPLENHPYWEWRIFSKWYPDNYSKSDDILNEARDWAENNIIPLMTYIGKASFSRDQAQILRPELLNLWQQSLLRPRKTINLAALDIEEGEGFKALTKANELIENAEGLLYSAEIAKDNYYFHSSIFLPGLNPLKQTFDTYLQKILEEVRYIVRLGHMARERLNTHLLRISSEVGLIRGRTEENISLIGFSAAIVIIALTIISIILPEGSKWRPWGCALSIILGMSLVTLLKIRKGRLKRIFKK
jgi:hypothetical protein